MTAGRAGKISPLDVLEVSGSRTAQGPLDKLGVSGKGSPLRSFCFPS